MELFGAGIRNLDLSPDGKRFAVFPRPEAADEQKGSVHVTVLLNFFDELRPARAGGEVNSFGCHKISRPLGRVE